MSSNLHMAYMAGEADGARRKEVRGGSYGSRTGHGE
jgi:hypothetical protein